MTAARRPPTRPGHFSARLDREWEHLRRHPRTIRRARAWADSDRAGPWSAAFAGLSDLRTLLVESGGGRSRGDERAVDVSPARADDLLCRLISLADDDPLAGRVVIQRVLPGLVTRSAPYRDYRADIDPVEVVVAAAWIALRTYDVERRPRHVAATLISDATYQAFRRPLRRKSATEEMRPPHHFHRIEAEPGAATAIDELAGVLREAAAGGLPAGDVELIRHLVGAGSTGPVATARGVTPRTIRNRRNAAVERVRTIVAA